MEANINGEKRNRLAAVLIPNLLLCTWSVTVLVRAIENGPVWRLILAGTGFAGILILTIVIFSRLMKLLKDENQGIKS